MHTILNCNLSNFPSDLLNVANMRSIQTGVIFDIFPITRHLCTLHLKTKKVENSPKVAHISHV